MDSDHGLHPFSVNRFDPGSVRLASIVHAYDYRAAVLRDDTKAASRNARSQRAERSILTDVSLPWGQQVAVIFQVLCDLVPAAAECLISWSLSECTVGLRAMGPS